MSLAFTRSLVNRTMRRANKIVRTTQQKRNLNLHEYRAKELMARHNIRVQRGFVASTPEEAKQHAIKLREMGARDLIVKAQILAGGRGKGHFNTGFKGGVQICDSPEQVAEMTEKMLGNNLITHQTTEEGQHVAKVLIHEGVDFDAEYYLAFLLERAYDGPVIMGSPCGGMEIEEIAESSPEKIKTIPIDINQGLTKAQSKAMAEFLGFTGKSVEDAQTQMEGLYDMFMKNDCVQVEINPIVKTTEAHYDSKVYCVDGKLGFDDFAGWRNKEVFSWRDESMENPREIAAEDAGLSYVGLTGSIGCMVNGAGLAMATMDVIKLHGGEPANFLDVGGGADEKQVETAFKIITSDPNVKGILVNIFGGIMKCDTIAKGVISAAKAIDLKSKNIPLVVRLEGTNVAEGKKLLDESGLLLQSAVDLDDAAKKVISAIK
jgi:succinyl-CoA synthetase beta subunit